MLWQVCWLTVLPEEAKFDGIVQLLADGLHVDVRPGSMRRERSVADLHRPSQKDLCGESSR